MSAITAPAVSLALLASARLILRLRLKDGGGLLYACPTKTIYADEVMAVRLGARAWLGFVRPYKSGQVKLLNLRGEQGWFDLAEVELLRLVALE